MNLIAFIHPETNSIATTHAKDDEHLNKMLNRGLIFEPFLCFPIEDPTYETMPVMCGEDPAHIFFDCWTFDDATNPTKVVVDVERAKDKWLAQIRSIRNDRLKTLDERTLRAVSTGDFEEAKRIEHIKKQLRDLPEQLDFSLVESVTDLRDLLPAVLFVN